MSDKPKRRFWQIHLSTAVVLTITLGVILKLQFWNHGIEGVKARGWPCYAAMLDENDVVLFRCGQDAFTTFKNFDTQYWKNL